MNVLAGSVRGVGVDACEVERMRQSLERTPTIRTRVFTADECADLAGRVDPVPGFAARFAAREAVMKAMGLGLGAFGFHDVSVRRAESGQPSLVVGGQAARLAEERGITDWFLSLTHTDSVAIAVVVASGR